MLNTIYPCGKLLQSCSLNKENFVTYEGVTFYEMFFRQRQFSLITNYLLCFTFIMFHEDFLFRF